METPHLALRKELALQNRYFSCNFRRSFTVVDHEFPLEGDAEKAISALTANNFLSPQSDIANEAKTRVRELLKTWEASVELPTRDIRETRNT